MSDLISRSALLKFAHNHVNGAVDCNDIARFPGVDAEHVRQGKWVKVYPYEGDSSVRCTYCKEEFDYIDGVCYLVHNKELPNYCPNCGARMDAKVT